MSVYEGHGVTLHHGDCLDVLRSLPDASVDSVVTDPPYGLEFMGKDWDGADGFRRSLNPNDAGRDNAFGRTSRTSPEYRTTSKAKAGMSGTGYTDGAERLERPSHMGGLNPKCRNCDKWQRGGNPCRCDAPDFPNERLPRLHTFQRWCEAWATECLRVLKPGGHLLAFGGTRTWHRLACAVEDAGFEVRDSIAWLYGCLSDDTEILTSEGWVRYDRAKEGQHALAFDTATGALAWQAIQHVHRYPYAGEMVRLHSEHTDQLLTPNHRVVLDAESRIPYASDVCDLRDAMVEAERMGQADRGALLLSAVQRSAARPGVGEARAQGSGGVDRREPGVLPREDDRAEQPRMEGRRYRVQEARELCRSAVRASAGMGATDGPQGRVHHGAPATDGRPLRVPADQAGSHQPREPRPQGQPTGEPDPLALEPGAQALRVGEDGGGRLLPSTGVTADVVDYAGVVWCITVPHGAFIARRNGLIFATGNSGFPKSLDVSKAIDKARTEDLQPAADVARWLVDKMEILGVTRRDICDHFEAENIAQQWTTHWIDGAVKPRVPRWEQWQELRRWLDLPDDVDAEVWRLNGRKGKPGDNFEGRDVLSERVTEVKGGSWAEQVDSGRFRVGEKVIRETAPATDAAREWAGWGTALKPAFEPVVVARKPLIGTVAANVLAWSTGALNVDGCRVTGATGLQRPERRGKGETGGWANYEQAPGQYGTPDGLGRWPANVVLDESQAAALDEQSGESTSQGGSRTASRGATQGASNGGMQGGYNLGAGGDYQPYGDTGGASRFFYVAKADASERPRVNGTAHPTVKPLDLMRWLVRLVTPPGGTVLEPFAGSGTTVEACIVEGFQCIAIEREADYLPLIRQRIDRRRDPVEALRGQAADMGLFDLLGGEGA